MTFKELRDKFIKHQELHNSSGHVEKVKLLIKMWLPIHQYLIDNITPDLLEKCILERHKGKDPLPRHSINKEVQLIRSVFNFAMKKAYTTSNPAKLIDYLPVAKAEKTVPKDEDLQKIIDTAGGKFKFFLIALKNTCARGIELRELKWEDVDFENQTITLTTRKSGRNISSRRDTVAINSELLRALRTLESVKKPNDVYVFGGAKPYPYFSKLKRLQRMCKNLGIPKIGFHHFRHWSATKLSSSGVPLKDIQTALRHTSLQHTERYIHSLAPSMRKAMEVLCKK